MRISDWSSDVCSSDLKKDLHLREGDRIRWTANDKERGLLNAALARVIGIDAAGVTVETADRSRLTLDLGDPMLSRLDLAYSLNMHMRSEERRDGQEWVSTCRSGWSRSH